MLTPAMMPVPSARLNHECNDNEFKLRMMRIVHRARKFAHELIGLKE